MSQRRLTPREAQFIEEALNSDYKICSIRLREGEHQYALAKTMASFQLGLNFPNVKDITTRLYNEEKTNDIQFTRKIQTILKKMEKSNVVRILPKKTPWELQRYALSSFKFQDIDKDLVNLATEQEIAQAQYLLRSVLSQPETPRAKLSNRKIYILVLVLSASYTAVIWDFLQPVINPIVFVCAFSIAVLCSLMLGKTLS